MVLANLRELSKNAKKMQKNAKGIAYMKKNAYLCSGFGNSPGPNIKTLKRYGKRSRIPVPILRAQVQGGNIASSKV